MAIADGVGDARGPEPSNPHHSHLHAPRVDHLVSIALPQRRESLKGGQLVPHGLESWSVEQGENISARDVGKSDSFNHPEVEL